MLHGAEHLNIEFAIVSGVEPQPGGPSESLLLDRYDSVITLQGNYCRFVRIRSRGFWVSRRGKRVDFREPVFPLGESPAQRMSLLFFT